MYSKVTVILPAHNEAEIIKDAIQSILDQSFWNTEIICCLDNCSDNTENIINDNFENNINVKIFKSVNNEHKKAGALNQLFNYYFDQMSEYILVMDADTVLHYKAIEEGARFLNKNNDHGAVCSKAGLMIPKKKNLLWYLQNIEYGMGDSSFIETNGNVHVCRGMYSMYRKSALKKILNENGFIYNIKSITEDYDLTLYLKKFNYKISANIKIKAYTDVPMTLKEFWIQRVRWIKGGTEDLIRHGYKKYTAKDINGLIFYLLIIALQSYFLIEAVFIYHTIFSVWTLLVLALYMINILLRFKYVDHRDKKLYLIMFSVVPLFIYSYLDTLLTLYSSFLAVFKIKVKWR